MCGGLLAAGQIYVCIDTERERGGETGAGWGKSFSDLVNHVSTYFAHHTTCGRPVTHAVR